MTMICINLTNLVNWINLMDVKSDASTNYQNVETAVCCPPSTYYIHSVTHLGIKLMHNLSDDDDVLFKCRQLIKAANLLFFTLGDIDPIIPFCLSPIVCLFMVCACGDFLANPCILLKSLFTSVLERSGNFHLTHIRVSSL